MANVTRKPVGSWNSGEMAESRTVVWAGRIVLFIVLVAAWELMSGTVINQFWISKPSLILNRLYKLVSSGDLWYHLSATLQESLSGLVIGMVVGTLLGVLVANSGIIDRWISPFIIAVYSLPKVSLAPLFIVWFGIGMTSKVIMVFAMVVFVAFYNAYEGIRNIDKDLLDMMKTFKAGRWTKLKWVVLPSIMVWILNSLRINIGLALIGSVIAELVGANRGIGHYISHSSNILDTTGIFTGLVIIMLLAVCMEQIVVWLQNRLLRYR